MKKEEQIDHATKKFYTTKEWVKYYGMFSYQTLRKLIEKREVNGLNKVLQRASRIWLIDKELFLEWIKQHKDHKNE